MDVIQGNHHGVNNCSESEFLKLTRPKAAIISCGNKNKHGHPHPETLQRLINAGVKIYQTEEGRPKIEISEKIRSKQNIAEGHILFTSSAEGFSIYELTFVTKNHNTRNIRMYLARYGNNYIDRVN